LKKLFEKTLNISSLQTMIKFFVSSFAVVAAQSEAWTDWIDILRNTFDDVTSVDSTDANSFTELLWDQLNFADATTSSTSLLLDGWLTGVDFDDFLSDVTSKLDDLLDTAGDTSSTDTSEIIAAIEDAGYDPTGEGWIDGLDLQEFTDILDLIALHLEILSAEGMDLSVFPHLDELEAELEKYGYVGLWSVSDIEEYLQESVNIPSSFTHFNDELNSIIEGLEEINSDSENTMSLEEMLSDMKTLIEELESEVDLGETSLEDPLSALQTAYETLELFA